MLEPIHGFLERRYGLRNDRQQNGGDPLPPRHPKLFQAIKSYADDFGHDDDWANLRYDQVERSCRVGGDALVITIVFVAICRLLVILADAFPAAFYYATIIAFAVPIIDIARTLLWMALQPAMPDLLDVFDAAGNGAALIHERLAALLGAILGRLRFFNIVYTMLMCLPTTAAYLATTTALAATVYAIYVFLEWKFGDDPVFMWTLFAFDMLACREILSIIQEDTFVVSENRQQRRVRNRRHGPQHMIQQKWEHRKAQLMVIFEYFSVIFVGSFVLEHLKRATPTLLWTVFKYSMVPIAGFPSFCIICCEIEEHFGTMLHDMIGGIILIPAGCFNLARCCIRACSRGVVWLADRMKGRAFASAQQMGRSHQGSRLKDPKMCDGDKDTEHSTMSKGLNAKE